MYWKERNQIQVGLIKCNYLSIVNVRLGGYVYTYSYGISEDKLSLLNEQQKKLCDFILLMYALSSVGILVDSKGKLYCLVEISDGSSRILYGEHVKTITDLKDWCEDKIGVSAINSLGYEELLKIVC